MKKLVYLVDDDPSVRNGLSRILRISGYEVEAFESAKDFLTSWDDSAECCLLLDAMMPGMTGPELQNSLLDLPYYPPIIFISAHGDVPLAASTIKKGATDFLTKPVDARELLEAIERALLKNHKDHEVFMLEADILQKIDRLTSREFEVMTYVIAGLLDKQVASELGISIKTVKVHRGRIRDKLGVRSVAKLVALCSKVGIQPVQLDS